jgi:hypothetical protein
MKYEYVYEFKWKGETSYQHGERQIEASPNDIVEICDEIDEQNPSKVAGEKDLPKGFREVREFPSWRGYPLKKGKGFYPSSVYKVKPRSKFFDVPGWQEYLHLVDITTHINWNRFFLVMTISFTSVWFLYAFVRLVFIGFILKGFKNKSSKGGEPD